MNNKIQKNSLKKRISSGKVVAVLVVLVLPFGFIGWAIYRISCSAFRSGATFIEKRIHQEQIGHYVKMRGIVKKIENSTFILQDYIESMEKNGNLRGVDEEAFLDELRVLEESSVILQREFDGYFNDNSIHYYPKSIERVTDLIYETGNLKISIDRFVRVSEAILLKDRVSPRHIKLITEGFYEIIWYVEKISSESNVTVSTISSNRRLG